MINQIRARARQLKQEAYTVAIAARDPRTPWYVKALIFFVIAHTFSPIDLIPDFIPVLGYLDDLIITPGGLWLALRWLPPEVMADARATAAARSVDENTGQIGAMLIVLVWIVTAAVLLYLFLHLIKRI